MRAKRQPQMRRAGYFTALMKFPDRVLTALDGYFTMLIMELEDTDTYYADVNGELKSEKEVSLPTLPGLMAYLGATRAEFNKLVFTEKLEDKYPADSIYYLRQAVSLIEDDMIQLALKKKIDAPFTKYLLSSYMGVTDRSSAETASAGQNHLHIYLANPEMITAGLAERFRHEQACLEGREHEFINKSIELEDKANLNKNADDGRDATPIDVEWAEVTPEEDPLEGFI